MAVTKIKPIKSTLSKALDYIENPDKTDGKMLVSSFGCSYETADIEFEYTLSQALQKGNNLAFHLIQSFEPGEVDYQKAHEIGKQLADAVTKGQHEYVLTTHIDKGHVHNHIIFCAVNFVDHHKYNSNKRSYYGIRNMSDKLCRENGLSVVVPGKGSKGKSYAEYQAEKTGTSWKGKLKTTVDALIPQVSSFEELLTRLQAAGYEIKPGKYVSCRAPGQERFTRLKTLGADYTEEAVRERIAGRRTKVAKAPREQRGVSLLIDIENSTANVTHNHPEGIKGAESTASAIYMARNGSSKEEIKAYIEREFHYDLSRTLDNIRTYYHHVESCQETVPEAIIAFLESKDFEDAIRNAVSLGGDTDTLGAITGSIAEAFYGIPAVLIAECKSRIDKGLMTDVLDEFDHVLGRSVDTYSDEVDETQANQMIEAAIDQYYIQQDKNGMLLFMEVMVTRMQQAGEVIVPYITENPFMSEEQISKVKAGDTISLDHDVRLKIETVKDADEKEWIGVFTSSEEMHKGSAGNVQMNQSIESILRLALNWEQVNGIVINPFGKYIQMTKKMIELLINGYEYNENERKSKDDENN